MWIAFSTDFAKAMCSCSRPSSQRSILLMLNGFLLSMLYVCDWTAATCQSAFLAHGLLHVRMICLTGLYARIASARRTTASCKLIGCSGKHHRCLSKRQKLQHVAQPPLHLGVFSVASNILLVTNPTDHTGQPALCARPGAAFELHWCG